MEKRMTDTQIVLICKKIYIYYQIYINGKKKIELLSKFQIVKTYIPIYACIITIENLHYFTDRPLYYSIVTLIMQTEKDITLNYTKSKLNFMF